MKKSEATFLEGERFNGFEHHVWLNKETGTTSKIPSNLGQAWQDMRYESAKRDLEILDEFGISIVETKLHEARIVEFLENSETVRKKARYLLLQPFIQPSHALSYADLFHFKKYRDQLLELMQIREEIKEKHKLGIDLLGGQGFQLVAPTLDPRIKSMRADVSNILVVEADIHQPNWNKEGRRIAKKGEALLCDTRLMPIGNADNAYDRILAPLLRKNQEFQDATLWTTLESLNIDSNIIQADSRFDTSFKRLVRMLVKQAIPKMIKEAEKMN